MFWDILLPTKTNQWGGTPPNFTVAESARLIRARALSPVELTRGVLERIEALDPAVRAFITITAERALAAARVAEREILAGRLRGPLHGVPFALKDIYDTAGIPTTGHSKLGVANVPCADAASVQRLYAAGAILVGKLATYEFAHGGHSEHTPWPAPRNPWNLRYATGGSSSGSAAAVAARMIPFAMGTDTGGSIRIPAAATGIAGLKPTYGLISRRGVMPNSFSFDHCGPMAKTVEDCALILQAAAGFDEIDLASSPSPVPDFHAALTVDLRGLRIGVVRHFWEEDLRLESEAVRAVEAAADVLSRLGARVETVRMAPLHEYNDVKVIIAETEICAVHAPQLASRLEDFGTEFLNKTLAGCLFGSVDYVRAQRERRRLLDAMKPLYERYDVLITSGGNPPQEMGAYRVLDAWKTPSIHTPFSVTGGPALSVCAGFTTKNLPLSIQIAGRPFEDATVLRVGHAYEQATDWHARIPPIDNESAPATNVAPQLQEDLVEPECGIRKTVAQSIERAGLALNRTQLMRLCAVAPYAFAMARRVNHPHEYALDPANVFRFN